ncbi:MAG: hypothetical protein QM796_12520 [Chthoniobacteraceae bacterium]
MKWLVFLLLVGVVAYEGYRYVNRADSGASLSVASITQAISTAVAKTPVDEKTGRPLVPCDLCEGEGTIKCTAPGCVDGWVDCPGPCLKLSVGRWEHMDVPGHDPSELWQKFTYAHGYQAWTTAHIGQVIEMRDGIPTNIGPCPICGGKGKVPCKVCQGTGRVICPRCHGTKYIVAKLVVTPTPAFLTQVRPIVASTPAPPNRDEVIQLKDGTTIHGEIVIDDGDTLWIRKLNGERIQIARRKLLRSSAQ